MKNTNRIIFTLAILIIAACKTSSSEDRIEPIRAESEPPQAAGGVNDGNTGELTTTKDNPWFVGSEPAQYCVEFGKGTAAASDKEAQIAIIDQIDAAFSLWMSILESMMPDSKKVPNGEFLAGDAVANLTRSFIRVECAVDPEMRIKVGTWDKSDAEFLEYTSRFTVAYALRTAYAEETGRSRGFLWLVPDSGQSRYKGPAPEGPFWSQGKYVQNVVLHELGHIFGLKHIPNTFMDAGFPAGVLAAKLSKPWTGDDLKAMDSLDGEHCGSFLRTPDDTDQLAIKDIFGVEPSNVSSICWRAAEDRRRAEDDGTPMLFWLKDAANKPVAEQLFFVDGVYGEIQKITGNYLKKASEGDYRYSAITHLYYATFDLYRMRFERNDRQHWVEAESMAPGFVAFRFAYDATWKTLGAMLISLDQYEDLTSALRAAQFEEDEVLDD